MSEKNEIDVNNFSWAEGARNNCFVVGRNTRILPTGFYVPRENDDGSFSYIRQNVKTDELIEFPDSLMDNILDEIDSFWNARDTFKQYGFLHRRGYLFYGPPGTGKTALTEQIINRTLRDGGVAFICKGNPSDYSDGLAWFRRYEPDRQLVCLYEDIDAIIDRYGESDLLSSLDGENQVDHVLNIATTNYPENLDKRIINRPRRFDRIVRVGFPAAKVREQYFVKKLNISQKEVKEWVKKTNNFSFAAMTDLVINVKCFGYPLDASVKRVLNTIEHKADSKEF